MNDHNQPINDGSDNMVSFEALGESANKCKRGVIWKPSVASFSLNSPESILQLTEELENGTYKPRKTQKLLITHPKRREAVCLMKLL